MKNIAITFSTRFSSHRIRMRLTEPGYLTDIDWETLLLITVGYSSYRIVLTDLSLRSPIYFRSKPWLGKLSGLSYFIAGMFDALQLWRD